MKFKRYLAEDISDLDRTLGKFKEVVELWTEESKTAGMHQFDSPPDDTALLFIFDKPGKWQITTEGMKWNLNILFFDEKGNLLHTEENCEPGYLVKAEKDCKYVIEYIYKV
jgi:uncharacterized membrane protein (UPF0127 family)